MTTLCGICWFITNCMWFSESTNHQSGFLRLHSWLECVRLVPVMVRVSSVGFKLVCEAHSDKSSAMWSPSVIALFTLFYEIFHCFLIWMYEICFKQYIYVHISSVSIKYIWNLEKLHFNNTENISQFVYIHYCEEHLSWSVLWRSSVIHHYSSSNLTKPSLHIYIYLLIE